MSARILPIRSNLLSVLDGLTVIFKTMKTSLAYIKLMLLMLIPLSMPSEIRCFVWDLVFLPVEECFDGASGSRSGVSTQIQMEEKRAVYTHCYGHCLNLAVGSTLKQSEICNDALDIAFEVSKLIKFSPKRNAALDQIIVEECDDASPGIGIRKFCPTRWTV